MSDLASKTVVQLKKDLVALGLPTNGLKAELVERLRANQKRKRSDSDDDEEPSKSVKTDEKPTKGRGRPTKAKTGAGKKAASKKDEKEDDEEEEEEVEKEEKGAKKKAKKDEDESEEEKEKEEKEKEVKKQEKGKGKAKDDEKEDKKEEKEKEQEKKDTKEATAKANTTSTSHGDWKWKNTLMYWQTPDLKGAEKIACFDYDGCLAKTSLMKHGPDAWSILFPNCPQRLKELHEKGYKLVIMTNQSDIGRSASAESRAKKITEKVSRLTGFINQVGLSFQVLVATAKNGQSDAYRKPAIGMWTFLNENDGENNDGIIPDKSKCFFVGDAAGRKKDHGDTEFAKAAGLTFYTEDVFFKDSVKYD